MKSITTESELDPIGCALIAAGFAVNEFLLDNDRAIQVPDNYPLTDHWCLPSRMFRFPIETHACGPEGTRSIGVVHPLLTDHPFVLEVSKALGMDLGAMEASNDCGYSHRALASWWHAVDLGSAWLWDELLATRRFTTDRDIAAAVEFALGSCPKGLPIESGLDRLRKARGVLKAIGKDEPSDALGQLRTLDRPSPCPTDSGGTSWPVNRTSARGESAWAILLSIEHGWLDYGRSGYLGWTARGRSLFDASAGDLSPVEADGQLGFMF